MAAVQEELAQAITAGEIVNEYDADDAQRAVDRAAEQAASDRPTPDTIAAQLDRASQILTKASETAIAAGKFGATIIKLAPVVAGLKQLVDVLF